MWLVLCAAVVSRVFLVDRHFKIQSFEFQPTNSLNRIYRTLKMLTINLSVLTCRSATYWICTLCWYNSATAQWRCSGQHDTKGKAETPCPLWENCETHAHTHDWMYVWFALYVCHPGMLLCALNTTVAGHPHPHLTQHYTTHYYARILFCCKCVNIHPLGMRSVQETIVQSVMFSASVHMAFRDPVIGV